MCPPCWDDIQVLHPSQGWLRRTPQCQPELFFHPLISYSTDSVVAYTTMVARAVFLTRFPYATYSIVEYPTMSARAVILTRFSYIAMAIVEYTTMSARAVVYGFIFVSHNDSCGVPFIVSNRVAYRTSSFQPRPLTTFSRAFSRPYFLPNPRMARVSASLLLMPSTMNLSIRGLLGSVQSVWTRASSSETTSMSG